MRVLCLFVALYAFNAAVTLASLLLNVMMLEWMLRRRRIEVSPLPSPSALIAWSLMHPWFWVPHNIRGFRRGFEYGRQHGFPWRRHK